MSYLQPPDHHICPTCNGDGVFTEQTPICSDCPFDNRDCKECIKAGDNMVSESFTCDTCDGTGEVDHHTWRQIINEDYQDYLSDMLTETMKEVSLQ